MIESEDSIHETEMSFGSAFGSMDFELSPSKRSIHTKWSRASTCRICLSCLLEPARLVCGHKFCERCLDTYWKANEEPEFVVCPLCRGFAFHIRFTQKDKASSTCDIRRKFDPDYCETPAVEKHVERSRMFWTKWTVIMPIILLAIRMIRPFLLDLLFLY